MTVGGITVAAWHASVKDKLKTAHSLVASIGRGGRAQMSQSDWGRVGSGLKEQYSYLQKLALDIEAGKVDAAFQIERRTANYAGSLRPAYYGLATIAEMGGNATMARRVINSKEGCAECAYYAALGFIPIEEMPEIGELICGVFCLCEIEYGS